MENILSEDEIIKITGLKLPASQLKWLHRNQYVAAKLNAANQVVISTLYFHQQSGAKIQSFEKDEENNVIDLDALRKLMSEKNGPKANKQKQ